eukprot:5991717-Prymnesium_polylepis.1
MGRAEEGRRRGSRGHMLRRAPMEGPSAPMITSTCRSQRWDVSSCSCRLDAQRSSVRAAQDECGLGPRSARLSLGTRLARMMCGARGGRACVRRGEPNF